MLARALSAPWRQGGLQDRKPELPLEEEPSSIPHSETVKGLGVSGAQTTAAQTERAREPPAWGTVVLHLRAQPFTPSIFGAGKHVLVLPV